MARGDLPIPLAVTAAVAGIAVSLGIGWTLTIGAFLILATYLASTMAYSLWLKRLPIVDVFMLASLYTLRLFFGIELAAIAYSPWLLVFSMFVFLSLSLAKRFTEVGRSNTYGREKIEGRGYIPKDAERDGPQAAARPASVTRHARVARKPTSCSARMPSTPIAITSNASNTSISENPRTGTMTF